LFLETQRFGNIRAWQVPAALKKRHITIFGSEKQMALICDSQQATVMAVWRRGKGETTQLNFVYWLTYFLKSF
jgi:hypothetical protein